MQQIQPNTRTLFKRIFSVLKPPPELKLSEWADKYRRLIAQAEAIRRDIEEKIEKTDGGLLSEILYLKYVLGKTLYEISFAINYSQRQTERLHCMALEKFSALQDKENKL